MGGHPALNGKAAAAASPARPKPAAAPAATTLDRLAQWIEREAHRGATSFVLVRVLGDDVRVLQTFEAGEENVAGAALEHASNEAVYGSTGGGTFALRSKPHEHTFSFPVTGGGIEEASERGLLNSAMQILRDQKVYVAAMFEANLEAQEINKQAFLDREKSTRETYEGMARHQSHTIDKLTETLDRVFTERHALMDAYVNATSEAGRVEAEAKREERKLLMKEQMFSDFVRPLVPLVLAKIVPALKTLGPSTAAADAKPETAAPKTPSQVTEEQAQALWNFVGSLEPDDIVAMLKCLAPQKREHFEKLIQLLVMGAGANAK